MAEFTHDLAREAIATKLAGVPGIGSATKDNLENWNSKIEAKVLPATYELVGQPDGTQEIYRLTIPCSLLLPQPGGKSRQQPVVSTITRGIQVAWRSGYHLGLRGDYDSSQVVDSHSRIESIAPEVDGAYADVPCLEWTILVVVEMVEVFHTLRSG